MKRFALLLVCAVLFFGSVPALASSVDAGNGILLSDYTSDELLMMWNRLGALLRANGSYPYSELERNDTGYEVTALQTLLSALGYYQKTIVDNFGNGTYNALREFERANGLKADGVASAQDQQALYQAVAALETDTEAQTAADTFGAYTPEEQLQMWEQIGAALRADGSYPYVELEKGDIGYEVVVLQTRLKELGYYSKDIVDNFGSGTFNAIRNFQRQNGLKANGIASAGDQQALFASAAAYYVQPAATPTTNTNKKDATSGSTP